MANYDPEALHREFGASFRKVESCIEHHTTPSGTEQEFVYFVTSAYRKLIKFEFKL